ncbi:hypothetical protein BST61_g6862 [Cercospora zeina]
MEQPLLNGSLGSVRPWLRGRAARRIGTSPSPNIHWCVERGDGWKLGLAEEQDRQDRSHSLMDGVHLVINANVLAYFHWAVATLDS